MCVTALFILNWLTYIFGVVLVADFVSGLFHWWEDRYGNPDWPIIGPLIIQPNIRHHMAPAAFTKGNYWQRNWTTIVPALILAVVCSLFDQYFLALGFAISSQSNEVHCWEHMRTNCLIQKLQRWGVLQHPRSHAIHHKRPYDQNYCVMTELLNPILAGVNFWLILEWLIGLFGVHPREERKIY